MSKLLELAKEFENQSKQEANNIRETVKSVTQRLEQDLSEQLKNVNANLLNVIEEEQAKFWRKIRRAYSWASITIFLLILGTLAALFLLAEHQYNEMEKWRKSAELYKKQAQSIELDRCNMSDGSVRVCVKIDPKYKNSYWGKKENLAILPLEI